MNYMYISGTQYDFEQRLHEFSTTSGDLVTGFQPEGLSYTNVDSNPTYRWNREYAKKCLNFQLPYPTGMTFPLTTGANN